ncbi:MAG: hypothetical protein ABL953_08815 [Ilumatobacteraceae bacterium]
MTRRRILVTLGVWLTVVMSLWASDARPAILVIGGIVAVVAAFIILMVDLNGAVSRVRWTRRTDEGGPARDIDPRVRSLRHHVYGAWLSGSTKVGDTLIELLDERLMANHRITRTADQSTADKLLTPSLRRLIAGPRRQTATARELRQILTDIEAL